MILDVTQHHRRELGRALQQKMLIPLSQDFGVNLVAEMDHTLMARCCCRTCSPNLPKAAIQASNANRLSLQVAASKSPHQPRTDGHRGEINEAWVKQTATTGISSRSRSGGKKAPQHQLPAGQRRRCTPS